MSSATQGAPDTHKGTARPAFPAGEPTTAAWREQALARAAELEQLTNWLLARRGEDALASSLAAGIQEHLEDVRRTARGRFRRSFPRRVLALASGSDVERVEARLDAAEADILLLAPEDYVHGNLPEVLAHVRHHLPHGDPQRSRIETIAREGRIRTDLAAWDIDAVVAAMRAASAEKRQEMKRVRSFRNVLLVAAGVATLAALALGYFGYKNEDALALCFEPQGRVVCPTEEIAHEAGSDTDALVDQASHRGDIALVEFVGLLAAAVATATSLRKVRGTSTPYGLPVALAVLKLPTGALTAVLGLLLLRGEFIPGLSALDTSGQILAWAVVFGYAQQVFTRVVDDKAQLVLDDVGGSTGKAVPG